MTLNICAKRQSVLDCAGHCLVLGGPGSGKTTLALIKAGQRINGGLKPGEKVLFLSFSRAAVARIGEAAKTDPVSCQHSLLSIQTFHSFFWQVLQGYGYLIDSPRPLSIVPAHDEKAIRGGIEPDSPFWPDWVVRRKEMFHSEGRICFDLFAPLTASLLAQSESIRARICRRYPLILVDEAQDTGEDQWECIKLLSRGSQVVCLADPDQMIYDFLPGVGPSRIAEIKRSLVPLELDLEQENNRSPNTGITAFARDLLHAAVRGKPYKGVSRFRFKSSVEERDRAIRSSIGLLVKQIKLYTGEPPNTIALLASYGSGVAILSSALQKGKAIGHQVLFDEAVSLLSSKVAAFLLEPKAPNRQAADTAILLDLAAAVFRAKGTKSGRDKSRKWLEYSEGCRRGKAPKVKIVVAAATLVASCATKLTGQPRHDWIQVKQALRASGDDAFIDIASSLDYLVAFASGKRISESLSEIWLEHGAYIGAQQAVDAALSEEQLLSSGEKLRGIHVMNMHKCKGKQFDGVILYRQQHHSPFVWRDEAPPFIRSRRLLHMAITRARFRVLILDEVYSKCPILDPHTL
jgi:DNA helicase-2/ATP-dependent DNA helicase PcrA